MPPTAKPKPGAKAAPKGTGSAKQAATAAAMQSAAGADAPPPPLTPAQEAERQVLIESCKNLRHAASSEEAQAARFHEEKGRMQSLWTATKAELEDARVSQRMEGRALEDADAAQAEELRSRRQAARHLALEQEGAQTDGKIQLQVRGVVKREKGDESSVVLLTAKDGRF